VLEGETRTLLEVLSLRPGGGATVRARVIRRLPEVGRYGWLVDEVARVQLGPGLTVEGQPQRECGEIDGFEMGPYLAHALGARAFVASGVRPASLWTGRYHPEIAGPAWETRYRLDEIAAAEAHGRFIARFEDSAGGLGSLRSVYRGRTRARYSVSLDDGFTGRTDLLTEIESTSGGGADWRPSRSGIRSRIVVRSAPEDSPPLACGSFDLARMITRIRANLRPVAECYEQALRVNPELSGLITIEFSIGVDGRAYEVAGTENTMGSEHVQACIERVMSELRWESGPPGGALRFAYPFIFLGLEP